MGVYSNISLFIVFINNWDFARVLNLRSPFPIQYVIIGYTTFIGQKFDKAKIKLQLVIQTIVTSTVYSHTI